MYRRWRITVSSIYFIDLEVQPDSGKVLDYGFVTDDGVSFHSASSRDFYARLSDAEYVAGHNVIDHDRRFMREQIGEAGIDADHWIDTLPLSALLFPLKPYHSLLKDEKFFAEELNNPRNDAIKSKDLFFDEVAAYRALDPELREIYSLLLADHEYFRGFFHYNRAGETGDVAAMIRDVFGSSLCVHAPIEKFFADSPCELAYCLANISANDRFSKLPKWVSMRFPDVHNVMHLLRGTRCQEGCPYCEALLDPVRGLERTFGFSEFRLFDGEPLQQRAVQAALDGRSLLAIFPTGGGKSITFQLPALMVSETEKALTVVISPLQSLMKDQVDNLNRIGIHEAATINGLIDPIERANAMERVADGSVSILYISPESLRSRTIEHLLLDRNIARFVIDEAHCLSAWGQDFRLDYMFIGTFLKQLQEKKNLPEPIPVSCFTATAKPSVIEDIRKYFADKNDLELDLIQTSASRVNLSYRVMIKMSDEDKYQTVRNLLESHSCPAIIYVNRTKKAHDLAKRLACDGFSALPYHGKMDPTEKTHNQEAFIRDDVRIIVATSAFGMGVDKKDVGLVIHFEISNSLENYVQEAGRAGRDQNIQAECIALFNVDDLDKHFIMDNQTRLSLNEIQQVWKAIRSLTLKRRTISQSAIEIARKAGWDDSLDQIETRVKTAIGALEEGGYLNRTFNSPRIFADSIMCRTTMEASSIIQKQEWSETDKTNATRIISKLIGTRSRSKANNAEAESRVDYMADQLGLSRAYIVDLLNRMRSIDLLADAKDMTVYISQDEKESRSRQRLRLLGEIEHHLMRELDVQVKQYNLKKLNESALEKGISGSSMIHLKTIFRFLQTSKQIQLAYTDKPKNQHIAINFLSSIKEMQAALEKRLEMATFILEYLYTLKMQEEKNEKTSGEAAVNFSVHEILREYNLSQRLVHQEYSIKDIENTLLYLSYVEEIKIEGGFLVIYNPMTITRLADDGRWKFLKDDYRKLELFYQNKIQQIHIVGEYAKIMVGDYKKALQFADDYFRMEYKAFLKKYFIGNRRDMIDRTITQVKFEKIFGALSPTQLEIINDKENRYIAVLAGPGSGKTRVLVHKLASLVLMENIKSEQMLMLTFSRAAATEFKSRLIELIGNAAYFIEIKTFHSFCLDLLGKMGKLEDLDQVVPQTVQFIQNNEVDPMHLAKLVLVIDEAQDMSDSDYALVRLLIEKNPDLRVIAVGDDDQNIYEFRGSSSKYLQSFIKIYDTKTYELLTNYRSKNNLVTFSNNFIAPMPDRLKKHPNLANTREDGTIRITKYPSTMSLKPFTDDVIRSQLTGTTCLLTQKNDQALLAFGVLKNHGIPARLMQTNESFRLIDLAEIDYFLQEICKDKTRVRISKDEWNDARESLDQKFSRSALLESCHSLLTAFEGINKDGFYINDFKTFLYESKLDDFLIITDSCVQIGTMHKAKGKEFDNVFMYGAYKTKTLTPEELRVLYVAITRAKSNLSIHTNLKYFDTIQTPGLTRQTDSITYPHPTELILQAWFYDVYLGFFLTPAKQNICHNLQSGDTITYRDGCCYHNGAKIVQFSVKFRERLQQIANLGYVPVDAIVRYVVFWKKPDTDVRSLILLPELRFERQ